MIAAFALDLGSTTIKAARLNPQGALENIVSRPAPALHVCDGRYESDALSYAETAEQVLMNCVGSAQTQAPLALCSQRSSFLIWDQASGLPVTPLISWQDNRGAARYNALRSHQELIRALSGLPLTAYYFAPKLNQLLLENPHWRDKLQNGEWRVGTLDSFLIWRWSSGQHFITDASMAARTQLMDINRLCWSPKLCELFDLPLSILPEIRPSTGLNLCLNNGLTLQISLGDQSAALIAATNNDENVALINLGTGGFVVRYLPDSSSSAYLRMLVYQDEHIHLAVEGTLNSIAPALAPYPVSQCKIGDLAKNTIFCIAEPNGLGAPYFSGSQFPGCFPDPRHPDLGIRFSQAVDALSPQQIATLLLEAIIFRVARILEEFHHAAPLERAYLSGGLSGIRCLQQGIADCIPFALFHLTQSESSLLGAASLAAGIKIEKNAVRIPPAANTLLAEKYQLWKLWLDEMLMN